jgi:hypothetical protein
MAESNIAHAWFTLSNEQAVAAPRREAFEQVPRNLFPFERVFEATNYVLNLALYLDCSLVSPTTLPTTCLTVPLTCFADPTIRSFSIISSSNN